MAHIRNGVCAVIVTYNIGEGIHRCVGSVRGQVDEIVIVDNGSGPETIAELHRLNSGKGLQVIFNPSNLGIAGALNQGVRRAKEHGHRWVLTLDHDSEATPGMVAKLLEGHAVLGGLAGIVAATPWDRYAGCVLKQPEGEDDRGNLVEIQYALSSGCMIELRVFDQVGLFNESLFLYYVDNDFCFRLKEIGRKIYECRDAILLHSEGRKQTRKVLWRLVQTDGYGPEARYYLTRNAFYILRKYRHEHDYCASVKRRLVTDLAKVLLLEDHRLRKLRFILRGSLDAWRGKYGPLNSRCESQGRTQSNPERNKFEMGSGTTGSSWTQSVPGADSSLSPQQALEDGVDLTVCILTHAQPHLLPLCIRACLAEIDRAGLKGEIILIDNASSDHYPERVAVLDPRIRVIRNDENLGFAEGNNRAIRISKGRYVLILNDDALLQEGSLQFLTGKLESDPGIGAVGPKLVNPDGSAQKGYMHDRSPHVRGMLWWLIGPARILEKWEWTRKLFTLVRNPEVSGETEQVTGACLLARRDALTAAGLFDERFHYTLEDTDLCLQIRRCGWRIYYVAGARVTHYGSASFNAWPLGERYSTFLSSVVYFFRKNARSWQTLLLRCLLVLLVSCRVPLVLLRAARNRDPGRKEWVSLLRGHLRVLRWLVGGQASPVGAEKAGRVQGHASIGR
jgi:rhamnosyltransferase